MDKDDGSGSDECGTGGAPLSTFPLGKRRHVRNLSGLAFYCSVPEEVVLLFGATVVGLSVFLSLSFSCDGLCLFLCSFWSTQSSCVDSFIDSKRKYHEAREEYYGIPGFCPEALIALLLAIPTIGGYVLCAMEEEKSLEANDSPIKRFTTDFQSLAPGPMGQNAISRFRTRKKGPTTSDC